VAELDGFAGSKGTVGLGATSDAATSSGMTVGGTALATGSGLTVGGTAFAAGSGLTIGGTAFAAGDSAPAPAFASDVSGPNLALAEGIIDVEAGTAAAVGADSRAMI